MKSYYEYQDLGLTCKFAKIKLQHFKYLLKQQLRVLEISSIKCAFLNFTFLVFFESLLPFQFHRDHSSGFKNTFFTKELLSPFFLYLQWNDFRDDIIIKRKSMGSENCKKIGNICLSLVLLALFAFPIVFVHLVIIIELIIRPQIYIRKIRNGKMKCATCGTYNLANG